MTAKQIFTLRDILAHHIAKQTGLYNLRLSEDNPSIWDGVRVPISEASAVIHIREELKNVPKT